MHACARACACILGVRVGGVRASLSSADEVFQSFRANRNSKGHPGSLRCQEAAPGCPPSAQAGGSAKGPGAVRFRGKGPQVGAAVAECERFRREITGDNPAQDDPLCDKDAAGDQQEAQSFGLLDPKLCYLLDGILFIYGVIVTALYLRAKFSGSVGADVHQQGSSQIYNKKRNPQEGVYNALQKNQMAGAYSEIRVKQKRQKDKGHNDLYQGLSAATKDTYDALHMQTLPPR
ncbi:hypothetical protein ACRRTK_004703 [Alexandromys fortis]